MKKLVFLFFTMCVLTSCNGQETGSTDKKSNTSADRIRPNENWTVNKELDENGNVIRIDSTYTWSYSYDGIEFIPESIDSLMSRFNFNFNSDVFPRFSDSPFGQMTIDSIFKNGFFSDDFFRENFGDTRFDVERMFKKADSFQQEMRKKFSNNKI